MPKEKIEAWAMKSTTWVGSTGSLIFHTVIFLVSIFLGTFKIFKFDDVLLVLTTAVSLEAIYLAIFIQMTVNRNTQSLEEVEEDIDEIQEDVVEIQENIDEISDEDQEDEAADKAALITLEKIQGDLQKLMQDFDRLKQQSPK